MQTTKSKSAENIIGTDVRGSVSEGLPYISVSGIGDFSERTELCKEVRSKVGDMGDVEMIVGVQATTKTQIYNVENSRGARWHPVGHGVWGAFGSFEDPDTQEYSSVHQGSTTALHYFADINSNISLTNQLGYVMQSDPGVCEPYWHHTDALSTLQINGLIPEQIASQGLLEKICFWREETRPHGRNGQRLRIILQLGCESLSRIVLKPDYAKQVALSGADYVLLDSSGGLGKALKKDKYARAIRALQEAKETTGKMPDIAIAGGLGPNRLDDYEWLIERFGPLSCDAEGNLRDYVDHKRDPGSSRFNPQKAAEYVRQAHEILSTVN